jgi:hypothetical protein
MELNSTHIDLEKANAYAKAVWDNYSYVDCEMVSCDEPGKPYNAFACLEAGAASLSVVVEEYHVLDLNVNQLKAALKARGDKPTSTSGTKVQDCIRIDCLVLFFLPVANAIPWRVGGRGG